MKFTLPALGFTYDSLEPYFDTKTMKIHHLKHHADYTKKFDQTIAEYPQFDCMTANEIIINLYNIVPYEILNDVRDFGGGYVNHNLFFDSISPYKCIHPIGNINRAIEDVYGSYNNFKKIFKEQALNVFGSGWTFLVLNEHCNLEIINCFNQNSPLSYNMYPLFNLDLWEHAYYLKYQNERGQYINNFFEVIDFYKIEEKYNKYKKTCKT